MNELLKKIFSSKSSTSPSVTADKTDVIKAGRTALLVGLAAAVSHLMTAISGVDLGPYTDLVLPVATFALDFAYRWLKDNTPKE